MGLVIFGKYSKRPIRAWTPVYRIDVGAIRLVDLARIVTAEPHGTEHMHLMLGPFAVVSTFRHTLHYVVVPRAVIPYQGDFFHDHHNAHRREPH